MTRGFPSDERPGLTSQLRRASVSVASNIVEGCARDSLADYIRFLDMAYGSAREVECQLSLGRRLGFVGHADTQAVENYATETAKVLNGQNRSLRSKSPD